MELVASVQDWPILPKLKQLKQCISYKDECLLASLRDTWNDLKVSEVNTKACTHQIITEGLKRVSPTNIQSVFIQHLQNSNVVSTVRLSHEHKSISVRDKNTNIYIESTITRLRSHYLFRFPLQNTHGHVVLWNFPQQLREQSQHNITWGESIASGIRRPASFSPGCSWLRRCSCWAGRRPLELRHTTRRAPRSAEESCS